MIPVKGFFEWQHDGNVKIPWYIYHAGEEIFSIAGVYDSGSKQQPERHLILFRSLLPTQTILLAVIHNSKKRMPVILDREGKEVDQHRSLLEEALTLLKPCPSEILKAHTISDLVNNKSANRNSPEVIQPFTRQEQSNLVILKGRLSVMQLCRYAVMRFWSFAVLPSRRYAFAPFYCATKIYVSVPF